MKDTAQDERRPKAPEVTAEQFSAFEERMRKRQAEEDAEIEKQRRRLLPPQVKLR